MLKKNRAIILVGMVGLFLTACGPSTRLVKQGDQSVAQGNYYAAAVNYLTVLKFHDADNAKSLAKLTEVARPAYEQKLALAKGYQSQNNLESALAEYVELQGFVLDLKRFNALSFVVVDLDGTIGMLNMTLAEKHYQQAEQYNLSREFLNAIQEYQKALQYMPGYKDCALKISGSYYALAIQQEQNRNFRSAAQTYLKSCAFVPNYRDATLKAASIYNALGRYFFKQGQCRNAYQDLLTAKSIQATLKDIDQNILLAKECATQKIAFIPFDNTTGHDIVGMDLGDMITEKTKTILQTKASPFIKIIEYDEIAILFKKYRISMDSLNDNPIGIKGVNYLVLGRLNQVFVDHAGLRKTRMSGTYDYSYEVPYIDSKGNKQIRLEWAQERMTYNFYEDRISLIIGGSVKTIETKTGLNVMNPQIYVEGLDQIAFVDDVRARHDLNADNVRLDEHFKGLLKARTELTNSRIIVSGMIDSIAMKTADTILAALDIMPVVSDPSALQY
jgi:tetratricopeptide (TPR) repeat protein